MSFSYDQRMNNLTKIEVHLPVRRGLTFNQGMEQYTEHLIGIVSWLYQTSISFEIGYVKILDNYAVVNINLFNDHDVVAFKLKFYEKYKFEVI